MALKIKHVFELSELSFTIPGYQRGYRWERKQIEQLLDDLREFTLLRVDAELRDEVAENKTCTTNLGFYCLQPLAVLKKVSEEGKEEYELIDGQQRLTTLYLIMSWLLSNNHMYHNKLYSITYDIRDSDFFKEQKFKLGVSSGAACLKNIDFYFMTKAYEVIDQWFAKHPNDISAIVESLFPPKTKTFNASIDKELVEKAKNKLNDVRFVWYEVQNQESSIPTFNDLNYGKISLTAAELIKALLFQENAQVSNFKTSNIQRSLEWSLMEQNLQEKYFWGMLNPYGENMDLHMEYILNFVAEDLYEREKQYFDEKKWQRSDKDWNYLIVNDFLNRGAESKADRVEEVWGMVRMMYDVFNEWRNNRAYYHQIGLLTLYIKRKNKKNPTQGALEVVNLLRELCKAYRDELTADFDAILMKKIGEMSAITSSKKLSEIAYGEDDNDLRKVLLLYCMEISMQQVQDAPNFPFHLMDKYQVYSLEHIHPQNLKDAEIDFETLKSWYENKKSIVLSCEEYSLDQELQTSIANLDTLFSSKDAEKTYNETKDQYLKSFAVIDKLFDEMSGMDESQMHTLYNMALVEQALNSALSNNLLDEKRRILKQYSTELMIKDDNAKRTSYVPLGTWNAFNKYYSDDVTDLKFWTKADREAYYTEIEKVYNKYHQ